jgi:hypothetical protein
MNLRFFVICICLLLLGYSNNILAQDSLAYKVPNLNKLTTKAKGVVSFISKPFSFLQKDTTSEYSKKDVKKKLIKNKVKKLKQSPKIINTGSYNPIKIRLPKLKPIKLSKIVFWKKANGNNTVSKYKLKQLKKLKIDKLKDKVEDIYL